MNRYNNGYVLFLPIESKDHLEPWLKTQFAVTESLFVKKDPENKTINSFVENVLKQLQLQLKTVQDDAIKQKLSNASLNISNKFLSDPLVLYIGLRKWVLIERQLEKLSQEEYVNYSHVFNLIQDIVSRVELNKETIKSLNLVNSWLDVEVCENNSLIYQEQSSSFSLKATEELKSILKLIDNLQNRVIVFLKTWQNNEICVRKGQLKSNTAALDIIQSWFEQTADLLCSTRKQLNALKTNFQEQSKPIYQELDEKNYKLLIQLINNSFIVEEQPSLVLRTKTKLRVRCRLLIGKAWIVDDFNPMLECTISVLNQKQAEKLKSSKNSIVEPKGTVSNNVKIIEYNDSTNKRVVSFPDIKLDGMERTTRKNAVNIADEKYSLVFKTNNLFVNDQTGFKLLAVSLPFIAIVHGSQESQAWAAVIWDNLKIIPDSNLLNAPSVSWNDLIEQLNKKFKEIVRRPNKRSNNKSIISTNEETSLTIENITFLSYMAFNHSVNEPLPNNMSITWVGFFRDKLPNKSFSFWDWFYNAMKLIQQELSPYWNNKTIYGFIDKATAISELEKYSPGTFILRFSENILGGLTTTFKTLDNQIIHICPYTLEDFKIHSFLNRMRDLEELKFIYPDCVKKCDVFGENLPFESHFSGYVNTMLVTSICLNKNPSSTQSSNTQHIMNNYSNGLFNREQYSCETNNQHYVLQNNYHYNKIDTASTYDDYSCSQSTNNYATKTSSAINTFEFSSYDSSTVLFSDSNFLSSSAYLLSSGGDYYL